MFQQGRDKQMKVKELKAEGLQKKYTVTIENKDFEEKVENKLNNLAKTIKLPGFRPGKAPKEMLKQKYRSSVLGEALDEVINEATNNVIKENNLRLAMQPNVKIEKFEDGKDIKFDITAELLPEIKLGDFSKIKVEN